MRDRSRGRRTGGPMADAVRAEEGRGAQTPRRRSPGQWTRVRSRLAARRSGRTARQARTWWRIAVLRTCMNAHFAETLQASFRRPSWRNRRFHLPASTSSRLMRSSNTFSRSGIIFPSTPEDVPVLIGIGRSLPSALPHTGAERPRAPGLKSATSCWRASAPFAKRGDSGVSYEAEVEIFEAALRYERERRASASALRSQVNTVFARLLENPFQFPVIEADVRRALVRDFPSVCSSRRKPT